MNTLILLRLHWKLLIIVLLTALLAVFYHLYSSKKHELQLLKLEHQASIDRHNIRVANLENDLLKQVQEKQHALAKKNAEILKIAQEKQDEINRISNQLDDADDRLFKLAQDVATANQNYCESPSSTDGKPIIVNVPAVEKTPELTVKMAQDFSDLSKECAINYERLKVETMALQEWSDLIGQ